MHTLTPSLYHENLGNGVWLCVYRIGRKWFIRKTYSQWSWSLLKDNHATRLWRQGFETQAMAISAAKGNRVS